MGNNDNANMIQGTGGGLAVNQAANNGAGKNYSDIIFTYKKLTNGDVSKTLDENAVNQSLMSLFKTWRGERFFNPVYGSRLPFLLWEPFDQKTADDIIGEIKNSIKTWESGRIEITDIIIDMDYDELAYYLSMSYNIKSTSKTGTFSTVFYKK